MTRLPARRPVWGERAVEGRLSRVAGWLRGLAGDRRSAPSEQRRELPELPVALRRDPLAVPYLAAYAEGDDRRAAAAAGSAAEAAVVARAWWAADAWSHRALWHFERADMALAATRQARRIGDIRVAGGDPGSARRYYAEAISEARDIGAEREEGLAALGMGRAALDLAEVTTARRLAAVAEELLTRAGAPAQELAAAEELRGAEKTVGGPAAEPDRKSAGDEEEG